MADETKILLVEDDEGHAELIRINLERHNITSRIHHFASGQRALDFLAQDMSSYASSRYIVILDINMPGLDGRQVLERLKRNPSTRDIPVIIFSTAEDEGGIRECYHLGCNLYLTKPIGFQDFTEAVHQLVLLIQNAKIPSVMLCAA
jgi:CheY-like chemotaxis protein